MQSVPSTTLKSLYPTSGGVPPNNAAVKWNRVRSLIFFMFVMCTGYMGHATLFRGASVTLLPHRLPLLSPVASNDSSGMSIAASPLVINTPWRAAGHSSVLRVMFVGDSITEGIAANSYRKLRAPRKGSCSYRFHLMSNVVQWLRDNSNDTVMLQTVGPSTGVMGAVVPPEHCCLPILHKTSASHHASRPSVSRDHHQSSCVRQFGRHAAIFGGTIRDMFETDPAKLFARRLKIYRQWFRKPHLSRDPTWAMEPQEPVNASRGMDASIPRIDHWMKRHRPHVVFVEIGTNDLYTSTSPLELVRTSFPALLRSVLPHVAADDASSPGRSEAGRTSASSVEPVVALSTLLWRVATDVEPVNNLLLNIQGCKTGTAVDCKTCVGLVLKDPSSSEFIHGGRRVLGRDEMIPTISPIETARLYCNSRVYIVNVGGGDVVSNETSKHHLYDGIHPSELGEELLANQYWREINQKGMWTTVLMESGTPL